MLQCLAGQWVLLQQCDPPALQGRVRQVFDVIPRLRQAEADPELGAFVGDAVDTDLAAHLLDQSFGNDQSKAGTAWLARHGVVRLTEGLEQRAQVLIGQADAGVLHADAQLGAIGIVVLDHGADGDGAFVGELDRVTDQIGQHLFEAQRIAQQRQRRVAIDQADQLQMLGVCSRGEDGQCVLDQITEVERDAVEHQLAGLDLGEVENLVDDSEQAVGGLLDGAQIILLARSEVAFLQQLGEAEDAVQWRADLVAHVGEEFGFDPAGLQGLLACQIQFDVLDLDGFQVLLHILGGLVDALLQFFTGAEQCFGHAVDAGRELVHFMAAQWWQAGFQVAVLELRDGAFDTLKRQTDGAAHAQSQQGGDDQAGTHQKQAGKQAAIATQQGVVVRQFQLQPADQLFVRPAGFVGEVEVAAEHRHENARVVHAADAGQALRIARRRRGQHARTGMYALHAFGIENGHGADVGLIQNLGQDALQAFVVAQIHGRRGQWRQLLGDELAALVELVAHLGQLHPGEVGAEHHRQQGAGQQRQHQHAATNS